MRITPPPPSRKSPPLASAGVPVVKTSSPVKDVNNVISPSEVKRDFFRSMTPTSTQENSTLQGKFLLGTNTEVYDSIDDYVSSPSLPHIEVPSDSQFASSQHSEDGFEAEKKLLDSVTSIDTANVSSVDNIPKEKSTESMEISAEETPEMVEVKNKTSELTLPINSNRSLNLSANNSPRCSSTFLASPRAAATIQPRRLTPVSFGSLRSPGQAKLHIPSPVSSISSTEFVSPSKIISAEGYKELERQVTEQLGKDAEAYELRYVRTVCTVIEERFICSEVIENNAVVSGSEKLWPVSALL